MENQMQLTEHASAVRGCLATLDLPVSPNARDVVENYLCALLNDYEFDNLDARLNLRARLRAKLESLR